MEQFDRMGAEAGFVRSEPGDGRAGKSAPARSPRRADDPSRVAVTREVLNTARYIIDMTAQLEAAAITAHLDRLAYFLGMANLESEIFVRTYLALEAERAEEESDGMSIDAKLKLFQALKVHTAEIEIERDGATGPDPKDLD